MTPLKTRITLRFLATLAPGVDDWWDRFEAAIAPTPEERVVAVLPDGSLRTVANFRSGICDCCCIDGAPSPCDEQQVHLYAIDQIPQ